MTSPKWLGPAVDFGPLLVFLAAYAVKGLLLATALLMATTAAALLVSYLYTRKVAPMPLATAVAVGIFGGLTLWLNDETFIKIKPTVVYVLLAALIGVLTAMGKPAAKLVLGKAFEMDERGWRKLSLRLMIFFTAMAIINEVVRHLFSLDVWVLWKVPGSMLLTAAFMVAQLPLIRRHLLAEAPPPQR